MDRPKLVKMANEIAVFFSYEPDTKVALEGVAGHLRRFWEPRMRREIFAALDAGGDGMTPLVLDTLKTHRTTLEPASPAAR